MTYTNPQTGFDSPGVLLRAVSKWVVQGNFWGVSRLSCMISTCLLTAASKRFVLGSVRDDQQRPEHWTGQTKNQNYNRLRCMISTCLLTAASKRFVLGSVRDDQQRSEHWSGQTENQNYNRLRCMISTCLLKAASKRFVLGSVRDDQQRSEFWSGQTKNQIYNRWAEQQFRVPTNVSSIYAIMFTQEFCTTCTRCISWTV